MPLIYICHKQILINLNNRILMQETFKTQITARNEKKGYWHAIYRLQISLNKFSPRVKDCFRPMGKSIGEADINARNVWFALRSP